MRARAHIEMKAAESDRKLLNSDSLSTQTKNSSRTVPITVRQHPTKDFTTGVIMVPDLEDIDEEDILEELGTKWSRWSAGSNAENTETQYHEIHSPFLSKPS